METGLLKLQSDVLSSLDEEGSVAVLVLLDLSDAFDTIDHFFYLVNVMCMKFMVVKRFPGLNFTHLI